MLLSIKGISIFHFFTTQLQATSKDMSNLQESAEVSESQKVSEYLKENKCNDVTESIKGLLNDTTDGPILLLAVHNSDLKMIKLLVKNVNANINQAIFIEGNYSTMLIHSIRRSLL